MGMKHTCPPQGLTRSLGLRISSESKTLGGQATGNLIVYKVLTVRKEEAKILLALNSQISHMSALMGGSEVQSTLLLNASPVVEYESMLIYPLSL